MKIDYIIAFVIVWGSMFFLPSHAQMVVIKDGYAAISADGYTQGVLEDASVIFEEVSLGSLDGSTKVKRVKRHNWGDNKQISPLFIIAPADIDASGNASLSWATAAGWSENANTTASSIPQFAKETGCPQYKGKDGTDTSGAWRLPTNREIHLMNLLKKALENTKDQTGFQPFGTDYYWSSTEDNNNTNAWLIQMTGDSDGYRASKGKKFLVRCIKDLPAK